MSLIARAPQTAARHHIQARRVQSPMISLSLARLKMQGGWKNSQNSVHLKGRPHKSAQSGPVYTRLPAPAKKSLHHDPQIQASISEVEWHARVGDNSPKVALVSSQSAAKIPSWSRCMLPLAGSASSSRRLMPCVPGVFKKPRACAKAAGCRGIEYVYRRSRGDDMGC